MRNEKYFCINCFENENIKGFIKDNGNLVQDKTFKCGFCQVSDWKHNEMYDIKDYDKKLFNSNEVYTEMVDWRSTLPAVHKRYIDREIFDNTVNCIDWRVLLELDKKGN